MTLQTNKKQSQIFSYAGKTFQLPQLGAHGQHLAVGPTRPVSTEAKDSLVVRSMNSLWDPRQFAIARRPLKIGTIRDRELFDQCPACPRILDMPIKFPQSDYRLPAEASAFAGEVQQIIDFEHSVNPRADSLYAYLTIDHSVVPRGQTQRHGGAHVDGFQGSRIEPKLPIDHSYVVSNVDPTRFFDQAFEVGHLDAATDNFGFEFDRQKDGTKIFVPAPYDIMLIDAYTVHEASLANQTSRRTFLRVSFTVRIFDRLGNTHNPMFDYGWQMHARDVQSVLRPKHFTDQVQSGYADYYRSQQNGHHDAVALGQRLKRGDPHAATLLELGYQTQGSQNLLVPPKDIETLFRFYYARVEKQIRAGHLDRGDAIWLALGYENQDPGAAPEHKFLFYRPTLDPEPSAKTWQALPAFRGELPSIVYAQAISEGKLPFMVNSINHDQGHWTALLEDPQLMRENKKCFARLYRGENIVALRNADYPTRTAGLQKLFSSRGQARRLSRRLHYAVEYMSVPDIRQAHTIRAFLADQFCSAEASTIEETTQSLRQLSTIERRDRIAKFVELAPTILYRGPGGQRDTYSVPRGYTKEGPFNPGLDAHLRSLLRGEDGIVAEDYRQVILENLEGILAGVDRLHEILGSRHLCRAFGDAGRIESLLLEQLARLQIAFRSAVDLGVKPALIMAESTQAEITRDCVTARFFASFSRPRSYFDDAFGWPKPA